MNANKLLLATMAMIGLTSAARAEDLKAQIESLRAAKVAWREIAWKTCLLDGLREARAQKKPVLLWIFIDRPSDDARC